VEQVFGARSALLRVAALKGPALKGTTLKGPGTKANALEDWKNQKTLTLKGPRPSLKYP
jgi:hypothetical protein